jgi:hypothetical protein
MPQGAKRFFRVVDHAAIYLLIAGTYTPFVLVNLRGVWGWSLFGVVWGCAVLGIVLKGVCFARFEKASVAVYVGMGMALSGGGQADRDAGAGAGGVAAVGRRNSVYVRCGVLCVAAAALQSCNMACVGLVREYATFLFGDNDAWRAARGDCTVMWACGNAKRRMITSVMGCKVVVERLKGCGVCGKVRGWRPRADLRHLLHAGGSMLHYFSAERDALLKETVMCGHRSSRSGRTHP